MASFATTKKNVFLATHLLLFFVLLSGSAWAADVGLAWDSPDAYSDGTLLSESPTFRVHIGTSPGSYDRFEEAGFSPSYTVTGLAEGETYFFAVTAVDSLGNESLLSNEISRTIAPLTIFDLRVYTDGSGQGSVVGNGIDCGTDCAESFTGATEVVLEAYPGPDSLFSGWSGGCTGTGRCTATVDAATDVTATFTRSYSLSAVAGEGGTVRSSGHYTTSEGTDQTQTYTTVKLPEGSDETFSIYPDAGYRIDRVFVDGLFAGTPGSYTFSDVRADHRIEAYFAPVLHTLSTMAGAGGTISPSSASVQTGGAQTFTILPDSGYEIRMVRVDGADVGALSSYTFADVTADHLLEAEFKPVPPVGSAPNLLRNGGLENGDASGWEGVRGIEILAEAAHSGRFGARMDIDGRMDQTFETVVGQTYYVSAMIRIDEEIVRPTWGGISVEIWDSAWKKLARSPYLNERKFPVGTWTRIDFSFTAKTPESRIIFQNFSKGEFVVSADRFIVSTEPIQ